MGKQDGNGRTQCLQARLRPADRRQAVRGNPLHRCPLLRSGPVTSLSLIPQTSSFATCCARSRCHLGAGLPPVVDSTHTGCLSKNSQAQSTLSWLSRGALAAPQRLAYKLPRHVAAAPASNICCERCRAARNSERQTAHPVLAAHRSFVARGVGHHTRRNRAGQVSARASQREGWTHTSCRAGLNEERLVPGTLQSQGLAQGAANPGLLVCAPSFG